MNVKNIKKDFPIFSNRKKPFVYLDSGATSQKPKKVIDAVRNFYEYSNANIHRGIYLLAEEATQLYESTREKVAQFINAPLSSEIIFTRNTNESINLVAFGFAKKILHKGDIVVLSDMEHHANILPWQRLRDEIGIELVYLPFDKDFRLDYKSIFNYSSSEQSESRSSSSRQARTIKLDPEKIKFISLTHASNVLGTINPIKEIFEFFKNQGVKAYTCVDGAQSAPHMQIDVQDLGCDFFAFSGHKMCGPSGVGILWGKKELLEKTDPILFGSQMILSVSKEKVIYADVPWKFEAGTGNLEGVVGLGAAVDYLQKVGWDFIYSQEKELVIYGLEKFSKHKNLTLFGSTTAENRLAVFSFNFYGVHPHDVAQILDRKGICVRSGHHCAQPLLRVLGVNSTARASCYFYNDTNDIDALISGLEQVKSVLKI